MNTLPWEERASHVHIYVCSQQIVSGTCQVPGMILGAGDAMMSQTKSF